MSMLAATLFKPVKASIGKRAKTQYNPKDDPIYQRGNAFFSAYLVQREITKLTYEGHHPRKDLLKCLLEGTDLRERTRSSCYPPLSRGS